MLRSLYYPSFRLHFIVFLTYEFVVKLSVVLLWSGHIRTSKEGGLESGGGSGSVLSVVCVGGSAGPGSLIRIEAGFSFVA